MLKHAVLAKGSGQSKRSARETVICITTEIQGFILSVELVGFKDSRIQGFKIINTLLYNNNSLKKDDGY